MLKVTTRNAEYLILTKAPEFQPEDTECDAAYGETIEKERILEDFLEIYSPKRKLGKAMPDIWIAEKYLLIPAPDYKEGAKMLLIGAGMILGAESAKEIWGMAKKLQENKGISRRDFCFGGLKAGIEAALAASSFFFAFNKFESVTKELEKLQKAREETILPYGKASSAMTAILLEKGVAPRTGKKKPVICVAADSEKTGVEAEDLAHYLNEPGDAQKMMEGYRKYLKERFEAAGEKAPAEYAQTLHHYNSTKKDWEASKINVFG